MHKDKYNFDIQFHEKTYQVIEIDFFNAAKRLLPMHIKLRDIYLIQTIEKQVHKKQNTMSKIAEIVLMSPSQFSNNIDFLSKQGILNRIHSKTDRRVIYLELTSLGKQYYKIIQNLVISTIKYTLKKLGFKKTFQLYKIVHQYTTHKETRAKTANLKKFADQLIGLYFAIINTEDKLTEKHKYKITNHDLKILTYICVNDDEPMSILKLSELFEEPFTTIASAVQNMVKKKLVIKQTSEVDQRMRVLSMTAQGETVVCEHIKQRKDDFDQMVGLLDDKNQETIFEAYQHIKSYLNLKK